MIKKIHLLLFTLGFCSTISNAIEEKSKGMQVMRIAHYPAMQILLKNELDAITKAHNIQWPRRLYWPYSFQGKKRIHIHGIIEEDSFLDQKYISLPQEQGTIFYAKGLEKIQPHQLLDRLLILNLFPRSASVPKSYLFERLFYQEGFQRYFPQHTQESKIGLLIYKGKKSAYIALPCMCYSDPPTCKPYIKSLKILKKEKYRLILQSDDPTKVVSWKGLNPFLQKLYQLYKMGVNISRETMHVLVLPLSSPLNSQYTTYHLITYGYIRELSSNCPFVLFQLIFKFLPGDSELDLYFRTDIRVSYVYQDFDAISKACIGDIVKLHTSDSEHVITQVIRKIQ